MPLETETLLPKSLDGSRDFMQRGLCHGHPHNDWWFPEFSHDPHPGEAAYEAQQLCEACPVKAECLTYAVENRIEHGIWGGVTERQRRRMSRIKDGKLVATRDRQGAPSKIEAIERKLSSDEMATLRRLLADENVMPADIQRGLAERGFDVTTPTVRRWARRARTGMMQKQYNNKRAVT